MNSTRKRKRSRIEKAGSFPSKMSGQLESELENSHSLHVWPSTFINFSKLPSRVGESVSSDAYQIGNHEFKILLYPGGKVENTETWVSIILKLCKPTKPTCLKFRLSILDSNGIRREIVNHFKDSPIFDAVNTGYGKGKAVLRYDLMTRELATTNDQLIILSEIIDLEQDCMNSFHTLCNHGKYLNNALLSDVKIIVKGKTVYAHKILISGYEVFAAMFEHNMKENRESVVNIDDIEFDVMLELMRFIYTGKVHNMERIAKELLIAADKYNIEVLKRKCGKYLSRILFVDNVLQVLAFANQYNVEELENDAISFFLVHKADVGKSLNFLSTLENMGPKLTAKIIASFTSS